MKNFQKYGFVFFLSVFFLSGSIPLNAQNDEASVKKTLADLISLSKSKSYEKAAKLIAYEGDDVQRIKKDSFNPASKDELNQVKRICKKITALVDLSSRQENGKFEIIKEGTVENFIAEINFISGDQKLSTAFTFIKTQKGFLLSDIN